MAQVTFAIFNRQEADHEKRVFIESLLNGESHCFDAFTSLPDLVVTIFLALAAGTSLSDPGGREDGRLRSASFGDGIVVLSYPAPPDDNFST